MHLSKVCCETRPVSAVLSPSEEQRAHLGWSMPSWLCRSSHSLSCCHSVTRGDLGTRRKRPCREAESAVLPTTVVSLAAAAAAADPASVSVVAGQSSLLFFVVPAPPLLASSTCEGWARPFCEPSRQVAKERERAPSFIHSYYYHVLSKLAAYNAEPAQLRLVSQVQVRDQVARVRFAGR